MCDTAALAKGLNGAGRVLPSQAYYLTGRKTVTNSCRNPICLMAISAALILPSTAYAYVDPGSGSVIVTTVLGVFAAIGYTLRKYFYKIRRALFGSAADADEQDSDETRDS